MLLDLVKLIAKTNNVELQRYKGLKVCLEDEVIGCSIKIDWWLDGALKLQSKVTSLS